MRLRASAGAWLSAALAAALSGCQAHSAVSAAGGDARQGQVLIARAQCGSCHVIPGVAGARGLVGPPLAGLARRTVIAGMLPNTRDNLARWLFDPQAVVPGNAMPRTGLSPRQAQDVTAYLETLN